MTIADPTMPTTRTRTFGRRWFADLMQSRARARLTNVSDLPPRLLYDIGFSQDLVDVMQRHRR